MARKNHIDESREPGGHIALPWSVIDSPAYQNLSPTAKALLLEVARQYVRNNNGRLLLSQRYLATRGWHSPDVITRAKRDLLAAKLIYQTVQGHRPNKASWYALTWYTLDKIPGYDDDVLEVFRRGMYRVAPPPASKPTREALFGKWRSAGAVNQKKPKAEKILNPPDVVEGAAIDTPDVVESEPPDTSDVAIRTVLPHLPNTSDVNHLEEPFCTDLQGVSGANVQTKEPTASKPRNDPADDGDRIERIHDRDLDPSLYDTATGEYFERPAPAKNNRAAVVHG